MPYQSFISSAPRRLEKYEERYNTKGEERICVKIVCTWIYAIFK